MKNKTSPLLLIAPLCMTFMFCFNKASLANTAPQYHHPQQFIASLKGDKNAGQKIYQHYCALCHAKNPRIPLGAPRKGIKADWQQRSKKGIDGLLKSIDGGLGAMPARGGCFECSDELLKKSIVYLLSDE